MRDQEEKRNTTLLISRIKEHKFESEMNCSMKEKRA